MLCLSRGWRQSSSRFLQPRLIISDNPQGSLCPIRLTLGSARFYTPYPKEGVFQPNSPPRQPQSIHRTPAQQPYFEGGSALPPRPSPPPPPRKRSWRPRWWVFLLAAICFGEGFIVFRNTINRHFPLRAAEPGSPEDLEELDALGEEFDGLLLVQQLRGAWRVDEDGKQMKVWQEWTAYEGFNGEGARRSERLTTGPLRGSAGLAAQRIFWNEEKKQLFLFINFGLATTGWPTTVHGGAIATICDEALGRVAIKSSEQKTAVTANLEINYMDKVEPGMWYVMFANLDTDVESSASKFYVQGVLSCCSEDSPSSDGDVLSDIHPHVTAKGLFVVPKGVNLSPVPDKF